MNRKPVGPVIRAEKKAGTIKDKKIRVKRLGRKRRNEAGEEGSSFRGEEQ